MSAVDQLIKRLIIERLEQTDDIGLLDFILKLLISESGEQKLDA